MEKSGPPKNIACNIRESVPNPAKKNELFKTKWAEILKVENVLKSIYKFSNNDVVCSEHFTEDDSREDQSHSVLV